MKINVSRVLDTDIEIIKKQLKTKYVNIYGIAARCKYNYPKIIVLNPIKDAVKKEIDHTGLANPLWLSCPYLAQKIHDIEQEGYVKKIQSFIKTDRKFLTMMKDSHAHFYFFRKQLYYNVTGETYPESFIKFFNRGIGGIADVRFVKCLHLHYCHYKIYSGNLAGQMTDRLLQNELNCKDRMCECLK